MKVLVCNRDYESHPGGDLIHIAELTKALKPLGIERRYPRPEQISDDEMLKCDLAHLYHLNFGSYWFERVRKLRIPLVVTAIFYPTEHWDSYGQMANLLAYASVIAVYSRVEEVHLRRRLRWLSPDASSKIRQITPGAGEQFLPLGGRLTNMAGELVDTPMLESFLNDPVRRGVLTVEPRSGSKNCEAVIDACGELEIPCKYVVEDPYELMPCHFRSARVYVSASLDDRFGQCVAQALVAGCRTIGSTESWGEFPGLVPADPRNPDDLREKIRMAYHQPHWDYSPNRWARENLLWPVIAKQWKEVYEEVLK